MRPLAWLSLLVALAIGSSLLGQTPPRTGSSSPASSASSTPDLSQEPAVVERLDTSYRFETDGTGERETVAAIRIQSQGGVQAFGQLLYPYASANERLELLSLRVVHPDGSLDEGPRAMQDLPAPVTAQFPLYSDLHFLHVTVPPLKPGDRLEYALRAEVHTPRAPGHFWVDHTFSQAVPALEEEVELDVPAERQLAIHAVGVEALPVDEAQSRRLYRWHRSYSPADETADEAPNVRISTFTSWDAVAAWYWQLQHDRLDTDRAMHRKVVELIAGAETPIDKVRAIYRHVSQEYRYLSLSFGLGRIQPHQAREVFASGYGDCKDKHTLLAALLAEIGIEAKPVLISTARDLVEDVPSPGQFDHLITAIPRSVLGDGAASVAGDWLWLDSTLPVAPFGYLFSQLRGRKALIVTGSSGGEVVAAPETLPFPVGTSVAFEGELSPLGRITGTLSQHLRGDDAVLLGATLLMSTEEDARKIVRSVAAAQDLDGEIDEISHSDPLQVDSPLEVTFHLDEPNAWKVEGSSRRVTLPQPDMSLPKAPKRSEDAEPEPLKLGGPYENVYRFEIAIPEGFSATPPIAVSLEQPFATYHSSYSVDGSVLRAERVLEVKRSEILPAQHSAWAAFRRAVESDADQFFNLRSTGKLDVAALDDVDEIFAAGKAARKEDQHDEAIRLLKRVTELDPSYAEAWFELGRAYGGSERWAEAEAAFDRAGELEPFHQSAFQYLAWSLDKQDKDEEAIAAYRRQLEIDPLDRYSNDNLGRLLVESERYEDAIEPLRRADSKQPDDANTLAHLFIAYLATDRAEEAEETKQRLLASAPSANDFYTAAHLAHELDRLDLAIELDSVATGRYPDVAWLWANLGYMHSEANDLAASLNAYAKAAELAPDNLDYRDYLGLLHFWLEHYEEAIELLEPALERNPDDEEIRQSLAMAYTRTGRADELSQLFEPREDVASAAPERLGFAIRGEMELVAARPDFERASAAFGRGDEGAGLQILDRILGRSSHPLLTSWVALGLARSKVDLERAAELAEEAEKRVLESLSDLDLETSEDESAARLELLEQVWITRSWVQFMNLDLERAAEYLRPVVWMNPTIEAATHLGQIEEQLGRAQQAQTSYALAILAGPASTEANNRLDALITYPAIQPFVEDVAARRRDAFTIHFRPAERRGGEATIRVLVGGRGEVLDLVVTEGDREIVPSPETLPEERFDLRLPPAKVGRLLLPAKVRCSPYAPECKITLDLPKVEP